MKIPGSCIGWCGLYPVCITHLEVESRSAPVINGFRQQRTMLALQTLFPNQCTMQSDPKTTSQSDVTPDERLRREAAEAFQKYLVGRAATLPADMPLEDDGHYQKAVHDDSRTRE